jgi:hypothetical protein
LTPVSVKTNSNKLYKVIFWMVYRYLLTIYLKKMVSLFVLIGNFIKNPIKLFRKQFTKRWQQKLENKKNVITLVRQVFQLKWIKRPLLKWMSTKSYWSVVQWCSSSLVIIFTFSRFKSHPIYLWIQKIYCHIFWAS